MPIDAGCTNCKCFCASVAFEFSLRVEDIIRSLYYIFGHVDDRRVQPRCPSLMSAPATTSTLKKKLRPCPWRALIRRLLENPVLHNGQGFKNMSSPQTPIHLALLSVNSISPRTKKLALSSRMWLLLQKVYHDLYESSLFCPFLSAKWHLRTSSRCKSSSCELFLIIRSFLKKLFVTNAQTVSRTWLGQSNKTQAARKFAVPSTLRCCMLMLLSSGSNQVSPKTVPGQSLSLPDGPAALEMLRWLFCSQRPRTWKMVCLAYF